MSEEKQTIAEAFRALIAVGQWYTNNESKPCDGYDYLWENLSRAITRERHKAVTDSLVIKPFMCDGISLLALHNSRGELCPGQLAVSVESEHQNISIVTVRAHVGSNSIFKFEDSPDD